MLEEVHSSLQTLVLDFEYLFPGIPTFLLWNLRNFPCFELAKYE